MARVADSFTVRQYDESHGSHAHDHFQILLGLEGALLLEIEGRGLSLGAGEGVVIAPDERHDFESRAGARYLVLDSGNAAWRQALGRQTTPPETLSLAHYLGRASEQGRPQAQLFGPALLLEAWLPLRGTQRHRLAGFGGLGAEPCGHAFGDRARDTGASARCPIQRALPGRAWAKPHAMGPSATAWPGSCLARQWYGRGTNRAPHRLQIGFSADGSPAPRALVVLAPRQAPCDDAPTQRDDRWAHTGDHEPPTFPFPPLPIVDNK